MQILIYDGECNMCNKFLRFIVYINKNPNLYITNFSSNWTKENIKLDSNIDSMIFLSKNQKYIYTNAILHLFAETNILLKPILLFKFIPKRLRDKGYKLLAKYRKNIIKSDSCPIPSKKFNNMYLD